MTIVVAHADTPPGQAALAAALEEGALRQEDVVLVPAVRGAATPDPEQAAAAWPEQTEALRRTGNRVLAQVGDLGDPSDTVVQVAQRLDASLIVLGVRHRSPVGKAVFGSTAQRIILDATCPVLTVKPDGVA
jgi:nucleotide-binding universal stress UspA family protein